MIVVFVNPRSRANRRDPRLAGRLAQELGGAGRVVAAPSLEAMDEEARALAQAPPRVIAVHGGDGTLHKVLTALMRAFGDRPLPPLALLGGGTMNVVSASLGIRAQALPFLRRLVEQAQAGQAPPLIHRRCMRVGDQYGFLFGNGLLANFLVDYYAPGHYGPARAVWLLGRLFLSAMVGGPFMRRVFKRFQGQVTIDGQAVDFPDLMAIGAGTVAQVGLGFKLLHRADDDLERFAVLAIHAGARALIGELLAVRMGRGISPANALTTAATTLQITPYEDRTPYTIDGDIYYTQGALAITVGPRLAIVDPRG